METSQTQSFLARHEFLIRRLHSLTGLVPVGAFMTVHLLTNSTIMGSAGLFQQMVYRIHSLGPALPFIEWTFIFIPLIFHSVIGVMIVQGGLPNHSTYSYTNNIRYSLQRASGMIAFVFIFWHVFHMHGWIHNESWLTAIRGWGGNFAPYSASSTAAMAMQSVMVQIVYTIGVLASVFHLANGLWTMGITWGLWVSPAAQARANWLSIGVGGALAVAGLAAIIGFSSMNQTEIEEAREVEAKMFEAQVALGHLEADNHKYAGDHDHESEPAEELTTQEAALHE